MPHSASEFLKDFFLQHPDMLTKGGVKDIQVCVEQFKQKFPGVNKDQKSVLSHIRYNKTKWTLDESSPSSQQASSQSVSSSQSASSNASALTPALSSHQSIQESVPTTAAIAQSIENKLMIKREYRSPYNWFVHTRKRFLLTTGDTITWLLLLQATRSPKRNFKVRLSLPTEQAS